VCDLSNYELQIRATEQYYDDAIRAAEQEGIEILSSVVPGSRLHQIIHNPVDSGIDRAESKSNECTGRVIPENSKRNDFSLWYRGQLLFPGTIRRIQSTRRFLPNQRGLHR
jgi:hypothetical protein